MIPIRFIIEAAAIHYDIKVSDIKGPSHRKVFSWPRQAVMYLCRKHNVGMSYPDIGRELKRRDHTTIMHGCKAVEARLQDPRIGKEIEHDCYAIMKLAAEIWGNEIKKRELEENRKAYADFMVHRQA